MTELSPVPLSAPHVIADDQLVATFNRSPVACRADCTAYLTGGRARLVDPAAVVAEQLALLTQVLGVHLALIRHIQPVRLLQGALRENSTGVTTRVSWPQQGCIYEHTGICARARSHLCTHMSAFVHTHVGICVHTCWHMCTHVGICVQTC